MPRPTKGQLQKTGGKLQISEDALQAQCIKWIRYAYPRVICWATPNGGLRDVRIARKLKATGTLAGIPDLTVATPSRGYGAAFIELKVGYNKPTAQQEVIMERLREAGYAVSVAYSFDEFEQFVKWYLNDQDSKRFSA